MLFFEMYILLSTKMYILLFSEMYILTILGGGGGGSRPLPIPSSSAPNYIHGQTGTRTDGRTIG